MNNFTHIEFRKERELGTIISHTFTFLRRNAKPLFTVVLRTCSIPFVLLIVALVFYTRASQGANFISLLDTDIDIAPLLLAGGALAITGVIYNAMLYGSTSEYIRLYVREQQKPNPQEVIQEVISKTSRFISVGFGNLLVFVLLALVPILVAISLFSSGGEGIGFLILIATLCLLLFFYVKFAVIYPIASNYNSGISEVFLESSRLVKDEWWMTFFTLLITGVLISIIGFVFQVPVLIYTIVKVFTSLQAEVADPSQIFDGVTVTLQVIGTAAGYVLYVILAIAINLIYFSLKERKHQEGSLQRIDSIGNNNA